MSTDNGFLLIFRSVNWYQDLSPEQMQQVVASWVAWMDRLKEEGKWLGGDAVEREGRMVMGKTRVVSDDPFADAKETLGGYLVLKAESLEEAVLAAQQCPGLSYGVSVEVRPIASKYPRLDDAVLQELTRR
ncbi:MAG TPA: YciI family protein [Verrucomicrobiota bacterium]|nr:YciI family protein [Verrucomicrobiota bacterium]HNT13310.1 YciI family protein [Verrucomicrobiota bacterium]